MCSSFFCFVDPAPVFCDVHVPLNSKAQARHRVSPGESVSYVCQEGYRRAGAETLTCIHIPEVGSTYTTWSANPPRCEGMHGAMSEREREGWGGGGLQVKLGRVFTKKEDARDASSCLKCACANFASFKSMQRHTVLHWGLTRMQRSIHWGLTRRSSIHWGLTRMQRSIHYGLTRRSSIHWGLTRRSSTSRVSMRHILGQKVQIHREYKKTAVTW